RPGASAQLPQPDPQPVITFSTGNYTVGEADDSVTITVTLSAPSSQPVTVDFATRDGTATGSPAEDADYQTTSGTIQFQPGQTSMQITVVILPRGCVEPNECFYVTLSNPRGATLGPVSVTTVTILDDDTGS
ncbi:MAG: hypothetical protein NZM42_15295, partial [Gemmatales bacterium]|nr:hypothetical protein [Gemmatales bacterium]